MPLQPATLRNEATAPLPYHLVTVMYQREEGSGWVSQTTGAVRPGEEMRIAFPEDALKGTCRVVMQNPDKEGMVWKDDVEVMTTDKDVYGFAHGWVAMTPGDVVTVVDDKASPPLTEEEIDKAYAAMVEVVEGAADGVHPPRDADEMRAVERWVCAAMGRDAADAATAKKAMDKFSNATCRLSARRPWRTLVPGNPRNPIPTPTVRPEDRAALINAIKTRAGGHVEITHRALDRFPGGNCDSFIVKIGLDIAAGTATAIKWGCFDGQASYTAPVAVPEAEVAALVAQVRPPCAGTGKPVFSGLDTLPQGGGACLPFWKFWVPLAESRPPPPPPVGVGQEWVGIFWGKYL